MTFILTELSQTRQIREIYFPWKLPRKLYTVDTWLERACFSQKPKVSAIDKFGCINYRSNLKITYWEIYCKFSCKKKALSRYFCYFRAFNCAKSVSLRISPYLVQMQEIRTRKSPNTDTFRAVLNMWFLYYQGKYQYSICNKY